MNNTRFINKLNAAEIEQQVGDVYNDALRGLV